MRTLSFALLVAPLVVMAACDRHGAASSAKPAPVAVAPTTIVSPAVTSGPPVPLFVTDGVVTIVRDMLAAAHGLTDVQVATTRVWTTKVDGMVVEWALSARSSTTGRNVGVAGVSVGNRIYADGETIRAQAGQSHAKKRSPPGLPLAPEHYDQSGAPVERRNLAAVVSMRDALVARDEAAFLALITDDVFHEDMSEAGLSQGKNDARRFFGRLPKDATFELHDTLAVGDWVIAESTQSGTKVLSIWLFTDGLVSRGWTYPDYRSSIAAPARGGPNQ